MTIERIENVKIGEFVRKLGKNMVYTREPYCRYNRKYQLDDWNDISRCIYLKKGTLVETDFDF